MDGAASGNLVSIANVIRMCLRFGNMATLEDGYGINLLPLATFAMEAYGDDPCALFCRKQSSPIMQWMRRHPFDRPDAQGDHHSSSSSWRVRSSAVVRSLRWMTGCCCTISI